MPLIRCRICNEGKNIYEDFPTTHCNGELIIGNACLICSKTRSERVIKSQKKHRFVCECGMTLQSDTDLAIARHQLRDCHRRGLKFKKLGRKYNRDELYKICSENKIKYYSSLNVEDILDRLLELDNIEFPESIINIVTK